MIKNTNPDVFIFVCHNCIPAGGRLPRQWVQDDVHVQVKEVPCTGKMNTQYLFHTLEGGGRGVCVVACPKGECTLTQGNYRAEIRVKNVQKLLTEIGIEPERIQLFHCSPEEPAEVLKKITHDAVQKFIELGASPIYTE